jgi:DNA-binding CsgD family transcriptional regulator
MDSVATHPTTSVEALACALAVLGERASVATASRLAGLRLDDGERAADELAAAGILAPHRPLRFAHPLMGAAIYASLPAGARAVAHRRAVRELSEAGARPMAVVAHACAVEPAGDPFVAEALAAAGRWALAAGQSRHAALLLERALAEPPPSAQRADVRRLLGRALTLTGDSRAPVLAAEALAASPPRERDQTTAELVDALWLTGAADRALALTGESGTEPPGLAAARAARAGTRPAREVASLARRGVAGATAFERCLAIAALIACDELDEARGALAALARSAAARGAEAELSMLGRLRGRLKAVERGTADSAPPLPGPDPGSEPWQTWLNDDVAVKRFGTASARAAALLAGAGDLKHLGHAVELLRGSPRRAQLPAALLALGRAQRRAGQRRAARLILRESLALAQRLGAGDLADAARDELRVAGARPRRDVLVGPASLTTAERRVADAATAGATNREIAAQLFLSPKTVEMHLGRVYRKLDIRSRAQLAGALGAAAA